MTPAQQLALESLAKRPLTAGEVALATVRNDAGLCESISAGLPPRLIAREVGERGVLDALGPVEGEAFLAALEAITTADDLPESAQPFFGAIRRGAAWLKGDGINVGSPTARDLLDLLASVGEVSAASVATLKALGQTADVLAVDAVSAILNSEA